MAALKLSMKILIDHRGRRVLFAEAGKDVVDFLFSMLSLPLGAVASLENSKDMVIGKLYQSMEDLGDLSLIPNMNIDFLMSPVLVTTTTNSNEPLMLMGTAKSSSPAKKSCYKCASFGYPSCRTYVTLDPKSCCPYCSSTMSSPVTLVYPTCEGSSASSSSSSSYFEGGFVKECVTYMIMDDLVVKPMSTISSITLFNSLNLKDMGALEEKTVNLTVDKVGNLLRASLRTKNVLTDVFFEGNMLIEEEKPLESLE